MPLSYYLWIMEEMLSLHTLLFLLHEYQYDDPAEAQIFRPRPRPGPSPMLDDPL